MAERLEPGIRTSSAASADTAETASTAAPAGRYGRTTTTSSGGGGGGGSIATNLVLGLAVIALVGAGWMIFEQRERLLESENTIANAERRIGLMEDRLRMTDASISESESDTNEQIGFWEDEIRKLWDLSNKRNRKWIEDNRSAIARNTKAVSAQGGDVKNLKSTVSRHDTALEQQDEIIDRVTTLDQQVNAIIAGRRDVVDKANSAAAIAARMDARLKEVEEAIVAIDANRQTLNRQVLELQQAIP